MSHLLLLKKEVNSIPENVKNARAYLLYRGF